MKKSGCIVILGLILISIVSASQLTLIGEPNTFTGVKLMIESYKESWSDPIYPDPDETYCSGGIARFNINSEKTSANIKLVFVKNGEQYMEVEKGPFDLTKNIELDIREKENISVETEELNVTEEAEEAISVETESEVVVDLNESEIVDSVNQSGNSSGITGFAVSFIESKSAPWVFAGIGVIIAVVVLFVVAKVAYKKGVVAEMKDITRFSEMNKNL